MFKRSRFKRSRFKRFKRSSRRARIETLKRDTKLITHTERWVVWLEKNDGQSVGGVSRGIMLKMCSYVSVLMLAR